jgi:hypothetical protein
VRLFSLQLGNPAGVAWNLARGLSGLGKPSFAVELEPQRHDLPADLSIHMTDQTGYLVRMAHFARIARLARSSEVVHFHFGIRPFARYLRKVCQAPFFVHYHGSDLREGEADGFRDMAAGEFIATPDLKAWAPKAVWIPNPVTVPQLDRSKPVGTPVVGHFPTNPARKGTDKIVSAIKQLQRGTNFRFLLVADETHDVALRKMAQCDIVIDQLTPYGVYGNVSVEAMLMGKVVVSSVNQDLYDRCPVVPIREDNIEGQLLSVLESPDRWPEIGNAGIEYANAVHHPSRVVKRLLEGYARAL